MLKDAMEKYERSVQIKPDKHQALYNWGNALITLARLKEGKEREAVLKDAMEKYERAVQIKPDKHEALNNWGTALSDLARVKDSGEREAVLVDAMEKYERAVQIEPDKHQALYNWGNALSDLATVKRRQRAGRTTGFSIEQSGDCLQSSRAMMISSLLMEQVPNEGSVVMATHGGIMRTLLCWVVNIPAYRCFEFRVDTLGLMELEWNMGHERWQLIRFNQTIA